MPSAISNNNPKGCSGIFIGTHEKYVLQLSELLCLYTGLQTARIFGFNFERGSVNRLTNQTVKFAIINLYSIW